MWLSSADEGVYCMNFPKKQFNLLSLSPQSVGQENYATGVRALFQSKSGDIWVGTRWQSVYRMDRNGVTKHVFSTGDEHIGNVYHIMEDDKGNLWFSTKGDGLVKAVPDEKTAGGFRLNVICIICLICRQSAGMMCISLIRMKRNVSGWVLWTED